MNTMKGIHGAGEALRGSVNQKIAKTVGDTAEQERMKTVRQHGIEEFRGSGLREGFREKSEGRARLRKRSASMVRGSAGDGLQPVDEVRAYGT